MKTKTIWKIVTLTEKKQQKIFQWTHFDFIQ
jgi:hypothetical protein